MIGPTPSPSIQGSGVTTTDSTGTLPNASPRENFNSTLHSKTQNLQDNSSNCFMSFMKFVAKLVDCLYKIIAYPFHFVCPSPETGQRQPAQQAANRSKPIAVNPSSNNNNNDNTVVAEQPSSSVPQSPSVIKKAANTNSAFPSDQKGAAASPTTTGSTASSTLSSSFMGSNAQTSATMTPGSIRKNNMSRSAGQIPMVTSNMLQPSNSNGAEEERRSSGHTRTSSLNKSTTRVESSHSDAGPSKGDKWSKLDEKIKAELALHPFSPSDSQSVKVVILSDNNQPLAVSFHEMSARSEVVKESLGSQEDKSAVVLDKSIFKEDEGKPEYTFLMQYLCSRTEPALPTNIAELVQIYRIANKYQCERLLLLCEQLLIMWLKVPTFDKQVVDGLREVGIATPNLSQAINIYKGIEDGK